MLPNESPRELAVGDVVILDGSEATITKVTGDTGPRINHLDPATVPTFDVISYVDGRPKFSPNSKRGHGPGEILTREEFEAGRPRTDLELVEEAIVRGERAPMPGLWIVASLDLSRDPNRVHRIPTRARVHSVASMSKISAWIYAPQPPEDPTLEDLPIAAFPEQVQHVSVQPAANATLGGPGSWCYADEDLIVAVGPIDRGELTPAFVCSRCNSGCQRVTPVFLDADQDLGSNPFEIRADRSVSKLCPKCTEALRAFLKLAKAKPPARVAAPDLALA